MAPLLVTRPGIVVPVPVDPLGVDGPTRAQARGPFWRRVAPGYYVPAWVDGSRVEQRIVEAIAALPPGTAATGWAAFAWILARWFPGTGPDGTLLPVPAALGNQRTARKRPGVELSEDWLFADDVVVVDGLPVTVPLRSVSHIARTARTDLAATQAIDMAAFNDLVSIDELACYADRLGTRPGTRRLRRALEAADENAWSPQEVRMRLDWKAARPEATLLCNRPVFDLAGNHLFTPDLFDAAAAAGSSTGSPAATSGSPPLIATGTTGRGRSSRRSGGSTPPPSRRGVPCRRTSASGGSSTAAHLTYGLRSASADSPCVRCVRAG